MNDLAKNLMLWVVVAVVLMVVFQSFSPKMGGGADKLDYGQFVEQVQDDRVSKVVIAEDRTTISGERKDGT
jgi:cell division protease FtsH